MDGRARRWRSAGLALGAGLALALGHPPFDFPYLALVAVPVLVARLSQARSSWSAAWLGWLAGVGYFALTLSWIVEPFLVDVARHGWMAPFALVLLSAGVALFWALGFGLAGRVAAGRGPVVAALALALGLTLAEYARSTILTGFPWALFAYVWVETPILQAVAWVGPHALGAISLFALGLLAARRVVPGIAGIAGLAFLWAAGLARVPEMAAPGEGPVVRLVQPNAPQHLKWQADMIPVFYDRMRTASAEPAEAPVSAVIWPETALPVLLGTRPEIMAEITAAATGKTPVILGLRRLDDVGRWFNSLAVLGPGGRLIDSYDKHHLVPFGEYIPFTEVLRALGFARMAEGLAGGFHPGPGARRMEVAGLPPFQPLICYEAIFPHEILRGSARPDWLLQITNDAWFGTWSGPYQHLAQARARALEQGLPLARSANTGVSAMIDPWGRVIAALPLGVDGFVDAPLPPPLAPPLYARTPDWFAPLVMGAGLLLLGLTGKRRGG